MEARGSRLAEGPPPRRRALDLGTSATSTGRSARQGTVRLWLLYRPTDAGASRGGDTQGVPGRVHVVWGLASVAGPGLLGPRPAHTSLGDGRRLHSGLGPEDPARDLSTRSGDERDLASPRQGRPPEFSEYTPQQARGWFLTYPALPGEPGKALGHFRGDPRRRLGLRRTPSGHHGIQGPLVPRASARRHPREGRDPTGQGRRPAMPRGPDRRLSPPITPGFVPFPTPRLRAESRRGRIGHAEERPTGQFLPEELRISRGGRDRRGPQAEAALELCGGRHDTAGASDPRFGRLRQGRGPPADPFPSGRGRPKRIVVAQDAISRRIGPGGATLRVTDPRGDWGTGLGG